MKHAERGHTALTALPLGSRWTIAGRSRVRQDLDDMARGPQHKAKPVDSEHRLFGLLTTDANDIIDPIHQKAMPVLLTTDKEFVVWLRAPWSEASTLQRPLLGEAMTSLPAGRWKTAEHSTQL